MTINRRSAIKLFGLASLVGAAPDLAFAAFAPATDDAAKEKADYTLRIATGLIELGRNHVVSTTLYNGQFPGPLLRLKEGRRVVVDVYNETDTPELVHWHGQMIPSDVDGAAEEGTPFVPAHGRRRIAFVPKPAGLRFYHTHIFAGSDLNRGTYTGLAGPVYIEPRNEAGAYDREVFLMLKEFEPSFSHRNDMPHGFLPGAPSPDLRQIAKRSNGSHVKGFQVHYGLFGINGKMLGEGEPIRVKQGERVLMQIVNASATEIRSLALPGHVFRIVALDGNPVPTPVEVPVLWLGTAERISAIVEMKSPGVWVLGDLDDNARRLGMGVVIEYAGYSGEPKWVAPKAYKWDYSLFGNSEVSSAPDETIELTFAKHNAVADGFNLWTVNGEPFSMKALTPKFMLRSGKRYRLKFRNASNEVHPLHLHRHSFELRRIGGKSTAGVVKDVVMLDSYQEAEVDFTADNPGPSLFHCHMQIHMDYGFMAMFDYA